MTYPALAILLGLVIGQRLGELILAHRNTQRLMAMGAREVGAAHYPLFIALHMAWILAMAVFIPVGTPPDLTLAGLYLVLQLARVWVVSSLGPFWTTRIITLDGAPLVRRGPYRFVRHPNYWVVAGEIAILPLAFGAWRIAVIFSILNAMLIAYRVRVEEAALAERRA